MIEPLALQRRPHWGRIPIPFVTHIDAAGRPDFRVHNESRRVEAAANQLCQLCGTRLGSVVVLVGQPRSLITGEPPAHEDCMEFAWAVCPWLAGGKRRDKELPEDVETVAAPADGTAMSMLWTSSWECISDLERGHGYKYAITGTVLWAEHRLRGVGSST